MTKTRAQPSDGNQEAEITEAWKPIPGFEGIYEVSDQGGIRRILTNGTTRPKTTYKLPTGHMAVDLYQNNTRTKMYVHRAVLMAFRPTAKTGTEVCHNNGVHADNRLSNLRWDTRSENVKDEVRAGRHWQTRKTHCKQGHEFDIANTYVTKSGGRCCRACRKVSQLKSLAKASA